MCWLKGGRPSVTAAQTATTGCLKAQGAPAHSTR